MLMNGGMYYRAQNIALLAVFYCCRMRFTGCWDRTSAMHHAMVMCRYQITPTTLSTSSWRDSTGVPQPHPRFAHLNAPHCVPPTLLTVRVMSASPGNEVGCVVAEEILDKTERDHCGDGHVDDCHGDESHCDDDYVDEGHVDEGHDDSKISLLTLMLSDVSITGAESNPHRDLENSVSLLKESKLKDRILPVDISSFAQTTTPLSMSIHLDVLCVVASHCDQQTCLRLCQASKACQNAITPYLYRHVHLTSRYHQIKHKCEADDGCLTFYDCFRSSRVPRKQESFIRRLTERADLRWHVQCVRWTILPPYVSYTDDSNADPSNTYCLDQDGRWDALGKMWAVLGALPNIQEFEMADLSGDGGIEAMGDIDGLFQNVASLHRLRLSGSLNAGIANKLLSAKSLTGVKELSLNNIQVPRELLRSVKHILSESFHILPWHRPGIVPDTENFEYHTKALLLKHNLFDWALETKFTSLTSLDFTMVSTRDDVEFSWFEKKMVAARYNLCVKLVNACRKTLQYFVFEQGSKSYPKGIQMQNLRVYPIRQMDYVFSRLVYEALISEPWSSLRRMTLKGVGSWKVIPNLDRVPLYLQEAKPLEKPFLDKLQAAIGGQAELIVSHKGTNFEHIGLLDV